METIPKNDDNPNYYVFVANFQRYKSTILSIVHPFGDSFDHAYTS
jgi:hypothetical protein